MAEIGEPERRRVLIPAPEHTEPNPYTQPLTPPKHEPARVDPERAPEKIT